MHFLQGDAKQKQTSYFLQGDTEKETFYLILGGI